MKQPGKPPRISTLFAIVLLAAILGFWCGPGHAGILNGNFSVTDRGNAGFGWQTVGAVSVLEGGATLSNGEANPTSLYQGFRVPAGVQYLSFTLAGVLLSPNEEPAHALQVALYRGVVGALGPSLVGTITSLSGSDAIFNLQQTGALHYVPAVTAPGAGATSGAAWSPTFPVTVTVDLSGVTADTDVVLYFDLIGGHTGTSGVEIRDVKTLSPPVAVDDSVTTPEDTATAVPVLANDTDLDGTLDPATVAVSAAPAHGTAAVQPNGTILYTPALNYWGTDSFTYTVKDNDGNLSNIATVTVTITSIDDLPVAADDSVNAVEDTVLTGNLAANDTPSGDGGNVWALAGTAGHGTAVVNVDGTFSYTPVANYHGSDSFSYKLTDADGDVSTATVTISVASVNDLPVAVADSVNAIEDTVLTGNLAANDTPSGDGGNVWALAGTAGHGTAVVNANGTFSYTPAANYHGSDSFSYTLTDADGDISTATVTISVASVNDLPVAVADSLNATEDVVLTGNLAANDTPSGDGGNVWALAGTAGYGTAVVNADGTFTYTPASNYNGPDSFTYTLTDGDGDSSTATVTITVVPVQDPPVADAGPDQSIREGTVVTLDGSASRDVEDATLTYAWTQIGGAPTVTLSNAGAVSPTFTAPSVGVDGTLLTFQLKVTDAGGLDHVDSVNIGVMNFVIPCDVNDDGIINITDAVLLLRVMARLDTAGSTVTLSADVDGNNRLGMPEVVCVLQTVAGLRAAPSGH